MSGTEPVSVERPDLRAIRAHLARVVRQELGPVHPRIVAMSAIARLVPNLAGMRIRTAILRAAGWRLGHGTVFFGVPRTYGSGRIDKRLVVGDNVAVNMGCSFELNDVIEIGDHAAIGQDVTILTSTHRIGRPNRRAGALYTAPVHIGSGAWIGARSVLLPGVTVGAGAVVAAGSLVTRDVPANALVTGVPAQVTVPRLPGR
jgi:maltose O-acetyltransferase